MTGEPPRIGEVQPQGLAERLLAAYREAAGPAGSARARAAAGRRRERPDLLGRAATGRRRRAWSGPGPDARDPAPLAGALGDLVRGMGWEATAAVASLESRWTEIVGEDIGGHSRPVRFVDGDLLVSTDSTAWATQLRLLVPRLLAGIQRAVGDGPDGTPLIRTVRVQGPVAPVRAGGPLRVRGRGPRDTYG